MIEEQQQQLGFTLPLKRWRSIVLSSADDAKTEILRLSHVFQGNAHAKAVVLTNPRYETRACLRHSRGINTIPLHSTPVC
jgi:hypothetical protein